MDLVFAVSGHIQSLAAIALHPDVLEKFLPEIRQKTVYIKTRLIDKLLCLGLHIFPTDMRVPIMLIQAPNCSHFASFLARYGIIAEGGHDFRDVHPEMNNSMARLRIPATIEEVDEAARRIELLLAEAQRNPEACFAD
jgi:hypothetical protein